MIGSIGGFDPTAFAASAALARQTASKKNSNQAEQANIGGNTTSTRDVFLNWMKKSPAERMEDIWLKAHGLSKEKLAAMDPKDREAVMKQMKEDIERQLKDETEAKAKVDVLA